MPIYEYQCQSCEDVVEVIQSFQDPPLTTCEECGGKMKKLISLAAFHLKGGGWYNDHYGLKDKSAGRKSSSSSEKVKEKSDSSKASEKSSSSSPTEKPALKTSDSAAA